MPLKYTEVYQYTSARIAVGVSRCTTHFLAGVDSEDQSFGTRERAFLRKLCAQVKKVEKWAEECGKISRKNKKLLSAGAMRDIDNVVSTVFYLPEKDKNKVIERVNALSASVFASSIFVMDAMNVAKLYTSTREWRYLNMTLETLAGMCLVFSPDADADGTSLYIKAAVGLDKVKSLPSGKHA